MKIRVRKGDRLCPEFLALKHESRILGHSPNPVFGFSMMEQVRLCYLAHGELVWLFLEPDTGLDHCQRILLSCFRARTSNLQATLSVQKFLKKGSDGMERMKQCEQCGKGINLNSSYNPRPCVKKAKNKAK